MGRDVGVSGFNPEGSRKRCSLSTIKEERKKGGEKHTKPSKKCNSTPSLITYFKFPPKRDIMINIGWKIPNIILV